MKAAARRQTLQSIVPGDFASYLRGHAWKQAPDTTGHATIWTKPHKAGEEFEILLPADNSFADYPLRIADALNTLGVEEQRDERQVIRDITTTNSDIVRINLKHPSIKHGSIPLDFFVGVVSEVKNVMLAAAESVIEAKSAQKERADIDSASRFVAGLLIRQADDDDAFLLEIESSVAPAQGHRTSEHRRRYAIDLEPFERRAMLSTRNALAALEHTLLTSTTTGDARPFQNSVVAGVSANLCEALVALSIDGTADELSFQFNWAATRPVPATAADTIRFGQDAFPVLAEAARILREDHEASSKSGASSVVYPIGSETPVSAVREDPKSIAYANKTKRK